MSSPRSPTWQVILPLGGNRRFACVPRVTNNTVCPRTKLIEGNLFWNSDEQFSVSYATAALSLELKLVQLKLYWVYIKARSVLKQQGCGLVYLNRHVMNLSSNRSSSSEQQIWNGRTSTEKSFSQLQRLPKWAAYLYCKQIVLIWLGSVIIFKVCRFIAHLWLTCS